MDMSHVGGRALHIAALVKQVPASDRLCLDNDGRLNRDGLSEMNAFCRRAVAQAILLARATGGRTTAFTMGPPGAVDVLREALACGIDLAVHLTDRAFAGSDTLVTARALAAAIDREGGFDLILAGRASTDSDTGSIGPQLAELLGMPFAGPVRSLTLVDGGRAVEADLELDDTSERVRVKLPCVLSTAERLCTAAKSPREAWPADPPVRRYGAGDLGLGPWGIDGSPTRVGAARQRASRDRSSTTLSGDVSAQVKAAVDLLVERGAFARTEPPSIPVPPTRGGGGPAVVAVLGASTDTESRGLLGGAAELAAGIGGHVVAVAGAESDVELLGAWGADRVLFVSRCDPAPLSRALAAWCGHTRPRAVLAVAVAWGREVLSRLCVALDAGLVADALGVEIRDGRLIGEKASLGGQVGVEIYCTSEMQCATVRPGALPLLLPRSANPAIGFVDVPRDERIEPLSRRNSDVSGALGRADVVVGVGRGVRPEDYPLLHPFVDALGAELGATRKVTDRGWLPNSRQIGTTGRFVTPQLYVAVGISGDVLHTIGIRNARTVLSVNDDPGARIFEESDLGIVADWREAIPMLHEELAGRGLARERTGALAAGAAANGWTGKFDGTGQRTAG